MITKIQIDHSKVTNLPKVGFEDKVIIGEHIDEDDKIKTVLWLERSKFKGKDRICLSGAAYKRKVCEGLQAFSSGDKLYRAN